MRHVFSVTVSKLVKQLLTTSQKPKRLGSEKIWLQRKWNLHTLTEMCGSLLFFLLVIGP